MVASEWRHHDDLLPVEGAGEEAGGRVEPAPAALFLGAGPGHGSVKVFFRALVLGEVVRYLGVFLDGCVGCGQRNQDLAKRC